MISISEQEDIERIENHKKICILDSEFKMNFNGEPYFDVGVSSWVCEVCGMEFFKYEDILYSRLQYDSGRYKVPVAGRKPYWF